MKIGKTVFAKNQTSGKIVVSQNGLLDLSSEEGVWDVTNVDLDLDSDGDADTDDISVIKTHLLQNEEFISLYDVTHDNTVNICDLVALSTYFS